MFETINRKNTYTTKYDDVEKKFGTKDLLPLWVADMDLASPQCVQKALLERALHPIYGYTVYPPEYYNAIVKWMNIRLGLKIKKEWIIPCYGVVPSINFAIMAYSDEGDSIMVQTPLYPPFVSSIRHKHRKVLDNTLVYENGAYKIDFVDFENKAKEAKLFLLCSPHNPTSRVWNQAELEQIIDICIAHDVLMISDEIHADIVYERVYHSIGSFGKIMDKCVIFNAPSKTFNIAGLNTSFAIIPEIQLRKMFIIEQNKSGITNGNPFGIEALISAYSDGAVWLDELKVYLGSNIDFVKDFLKRHSIPIYIVPTEATFLLWLDCKEMNMSHEELLEFFFCKAKLGLNDGKSFASAGEGFMRLNIGTSKEILEVAMERIHKAYKEIF